MRIEAIDMDLRPNGDTHWFAYERGLTVSLLRVSDDRWQASAWGDVSVTAYGETAEAAFVELLAIARDGAPGVYASMTGTMRQDVGEINARCAELTARLELKRLAEAATPGPYETDGDGGNDVWGREGSVYIGHCEHDADAAFIAAANPAAVLGLLARAEAAEALAASRPEITPNISDLLATVLEVERACRDVGESRPLWWDIAIPALRAHAAKVSR